MRKLSILSVMFISLVSNAQAAISTAEVKSNLLNKYMVNYNDKKQMAALKAETLKHSGQSVEALIEVMKNGKYPDKNRWMATFLLGQIMGDKSAPFLAKFFDHPHWVMRMASLKTMQALKQKDYSSSYVKLLKDDSLIVRTQALETIRSLNVKEAAPHVWAMLYDKKNYYVPTAKGKELKSKRTHIIKEAIVTVGDLKFEKARAPLLTMIQKDKYKDVFNEMDTSLAKITGLKSPNGDTNQKKIFWKRQALNTVIR